MSKNPEFGNVGMKRVALRGRFASIWSGELPYGNKTVFSIETLAPAAGVAPELNSVDIVALH